MRLEFNVVLIDDDIDDPDTSRPVLDLIDKLNKGIERKGFIPQIKTYSSIYAITGIDLKRIDLFISDNNLGDNLHHLDSSQKNGGIDYYLTLSRQFICDYVLYTRSQKTEIIGKLITDLNTYQNPNLFSRFTFVSREDSDWHAPIFKVIDHILTKREEINNLRGLFAQKMSKIHIHLKKSFRLKGDINLEESINAIPPQKISSLQKRNLHRLRCIRNGLLHNNEEFDEQRKVYYIEFDFNGATERIVESEFSLQRKHLKEMFDFVETL